VGHPSRIRNCVEFSMKAICIKAEGQLYERDRQTHNAILSSIGTQVEICGIDHVSYFYDHAVDAYGSLSWTRVNFIERQDQICPDH